MTSAATAQQEPVQQGPTRVAIMDLKAPGFDKGIAENLYGILVAEIDSMPQFRVVARDEIEAMLGFEQQKALLGCDDTSCLAEIAGALGVDKVIAGKVGKVGQTFVINLTMIDHKTARVEKRLVKTVKGEVDLLIGAIALYGRELVGEKPVAAAAPPQTPTSKPKTTPAVAAAPSASQSAQEEGEFPLLPVVALAAGGVGLLASGGLLGLSMLRYETYQNSTNSQQAQDLHGEILGEWIGSGAAAGLGLVCLGAGVVLFVVSE